MTLTSCSKSCGTQAQLTGGQASGRPRSARTEENAKLLLQKFPQSATDFVLCTAPVETFQTQVLTNNMGHG